MTIWINATTSYNWEGPVVGIVRTEKEFICQFLKFSEEECKLFSVKDKRTYEIINKEVYKNKFNSIQINKSEKEEKVLKKDENVSVPALLFPLLTKKQAILNISQGILSLAPSFSRPLVNLFLKKSKNICSYLIRIRKFKKHNEGKTKHIQSHQSPNIINLPIKTGDTLISLGLDWDNLNFDDIYSLKKGKGIKVISFCYDAIPIKFPQYCCFDSSKLFKEYFISLSSVSDMVICISNKSKSDLRNVLFRLGCNIPKLEVVHLASWNKKETTTKNESDFCFGHNIELGKFILFVSTVERRKNHELLYKAYHILLERYERDTVPTLVFVGMKGWGVEDLYKDIKLDPLIKDKILFLGRVDDVELEKLYKNCLFVCFPSFYEGWGLPVQEAFSFGKFVISSNGGSLPEVGGELAEYADPYNASEWAEKIYYFSNNLNELTQREEKIKQLYQARSWKDFYLDVVSKIENFEQ